MKSGWNPERYLLSCDAFSVRVTVANGKILDIEVVRDGLEHKHLHSFLAGAYEDLIDYASEWGSMKEKRIGSNRKPAVKP